MTFLEAFKEEKWKGKKIKVWIRILFNTEYPVIENICVTYKHRYANFKKKKGNLSTDF